MTLARLLVAIGASTRGFQRGLRGAGDAVDSLERKTGRMRRGFGNATGGLAAFAKKAMFVGTIVLVALAGGLGLVAEKAIAWEDAFAGVAKTVQATDAELAGLSRGIRDLSLEIPVAATELAHIAETAGALGIKGSENILAFTKTVAQLAVTTNLTSDAAADALGRIGTILGLQGDDFAKFGSALVALGNQGASTESEIIAITQRFAASGKQAGLSTDQILGYASAISSLGVEPEAAGSSLSRMFSNIIQETALATDKGKGFAKVAGKSFKDFSKIVRTDTNRAMLLFLQGLGKLDKFGASKALESVGITDVRQRDAVLKLAQNFGFLNDQLTIAEKNIASTDAITAEAEKRFATTKSQLVRLGNVLTDVAVTLGMAVLPTIIALIKPLGEWIRQNEDLIAQLAGNLATGLQTVIGFIGDVVSAVVGWVSANWPLIEQIGTILLGAIGAVVAFVRDQLIPAFVSIVTWIGENVVPKVQSLITSLTGPGGVAESVMGVVGPILKDLIPAFGTMLLKASDLMGALGRLVALMWGDGKGPLAVAVKLIGGAFTLLAGIIGNTLGLVADLIDRLVRGIEKAQEFVRSIGLAVDANKLGPGVQNYLNETGGAIPGFAHGVTNFRGGPALVGEQGPEIVNLPRGSDVIPIRGGDDNSRGGDTYINITNPEPRAADSDISRVMRRIEGLGLVGARRAGALG